MAKDHVFDDLVAQAHSASMMSEHVSPIARSRHLINTYMELLPQYLADNPDQLPEGPDPAKRDEKPPVMSEAAKARRAAQAKDKAAAEAKAKAAEEAAKEAAKEAALKNKATENKFEPKADLKPAPHDNDHAKRNR